MDQLELIQLFRNNRIFNKLFNRRQYQGQWSSEFMDHVSKEFYFQQVEFMNTLNLLAFLFKRKFQFLPLLNKLSREEHRTNKQNSIENKGSFCFPESWLDNN